MRLPSYILENLAQLELNGINFDETFNTLSGGKAGQTFSKRAAIGAGWTPEGRIGPRKPFWCLTCRFLAWAVQPSHCALQFNPGPTLWKTWIRAGIWFTVVSFGAFSIVQQFISIVKGIL